MSFTHFIAILFYNYWNFKSFTRKNKVIDLVKIFEKALVSYKIGAYKKKEVTEIQKKQ